MKGRAATVIALAVAAASSSAYGVVTLTETFDTDPIARGWSGVNNIGSNPSAPMNYGYSPTDNTGTSPNPYWGTATGAGEIGGQVNRAPNSFYGVDLGGPVDFATNDMDVQGIMWLQSRGSSTTLNIGWSKGIDTVNSGGASAMFMSWDDGYNGVSGMRANQADGNNIGGAVDGPSWPDPASNTTVPVPFEMKWVASTGTFTMDLNGTIGTKVLDAGQIAQLDQMTYWGIWSRTNSTPDNYNTVWFDDIRFTAAAAVTTAPIPTWFVDNSGDWAASANWKGGAVPNGVGATVVFGDKITADRLVYSNSNVTVGTMTFSDDNTYLLAGLGTLTLQDSDGTANVNVTLGTHKINLPLNIATNTVVQVDAGATLKISDPMTINSGISLSQTGAGTVTYESTVNVLSGGSFAMANSAHLASLSMAATAKTSVSAGGNKVLTVDGLAMDSSSKLDLNDNDLVVNGGNFSQIRSLVLQGLSRSVDPSKTGIISSTGQVDGDKVLAVVDNALAHLSSLSGQTVATNAVLGKYTYFGDMNLDGQVTGDDYPLIDLNLNTTPASGIAWLKGDANLDGKVTGDDYPLVDLNLNTTPAAGEAWLKGDANLDGKVTGDDYPLIDLNLGKGVGNPLSATSISVSAVDGVVAVPEPGSIGLLCVAGAGLLMRRRRQR